MKLSAKLAWSLALVMAAMLASSYLIATRVVLDGFRHIEQDRARINVERAMQSIESRQDQFLVPLADWANWDAAYRFMDGAGEDFVKENLLPEAFRNLNVDAMIFVNTAGEIVWSSGLDAERAEMAPLSEGVLRLIGTQPSLTTFAPDRDWTVGLVAQDTGPMIVAARPVLTSEGKGPSRGALIMGHYLTDEDVAEVARDLRMDLALLPVGAPGDTDDPGVLDALAQGSACEIRLHGNLRMAGYGLLRDLSGQPLLLLRVAMDRDVFQQGLRTFQLFAALLLGAGVGFALILLFLQDRLIIARLRRLGAQVSRIAPGSDAPTPIALPGSDELSALADSINRMVAREHESRRAMAESRLQYEILFREMLTGFAVHDIICDDAGQPVDYRFIAVNPAFERLTGLKAAATVGRTVREVMPQIEPRWIETYGRVALTGEPVSFEDFSQPLDKHFEVTAFRTAPGQFATVFADVTTRKRAEQRAEELLKESNRARTALLGILEDERRMKADLRSSKESYRDLFENMLSGYAHCRMEQEDGKPADFTYLSVNPAFAKITGLQAVTGRKVSEVIPGIQKSNPEVFEIYGRVADSGVPATFETLVPGLGIWFSVAVHSPKRGEFVAVFNDITARKQAEIALRLQGAALAAAANSIVITDRNGTILWVNPAFAAATGYTADEALGRNPRDLIRSGVHDIAYYRKMWDTILDGKVWRGEIVNRRKDGRLYTEEMTITPVRDEAGRIENFVAIKQDVTDRKQMEAHLLRIQRLESVGRLASGIAHDLNNILTPVLMAPAILREVIQDKAALSVVDSIEASAERGASIIKQLLTFGRGAATNRAPLALRTLMRDMMKIIAETFPKNIEACVDLPSDVLLVNGDPTQLHQVLMNLCVNARDAMPEGGRLTLALSQTTVSDSLSAANPGSRPGPHALLAVSDTGTGISPEILDKIFDPFFTTKPVGEGTGLGLSTVLAIVRGHDGILQVDSRPGEGTTFRIYLPITQLDVAPARDASPAPLPQGKGEWVLLVDDEDQIRRVTRRTLEQNGYHSIEAKNGEEALSLFDRERGRIKAVITDLMMPVMDGPALIRALRARDPQIPIIAISGYLSQPELLKAVESDAQTFLSKPCSATALLQALQDVLRRA